MRYRASAKETGLVGDIEAQLAVWRPGTNAVRDALPAVRRLTELQRVLVVSPVVVASTGIVIERFDADGFAEGDAFARNFGAFFRDAPPRYAWYNAATPEPWQRNRVIDALDLMPREELAASAICRDVLVPSGLAQCHQPRALLCEGPTLLGWFGAFHDAVPDMRARSLLTRLLRIFRRRLSTDRRIAELMRQEATLRAGLEVLGGPAMTIDAQGRVHDANAAARALLVTRRGDVRSSLEAALRGGQGVFTIELIPVSEGGVASAWLALVCDGAAARLRARVGEAALRWALSARQSEILARVVDGEANITIALSLQVSVRAVEQHVSALLAKADVGTRAALVAATLAPSENRSTAGVRASDS